MVEDTETRILIGVSSMQLEGSGRQFTANRVALIQGQRERTTRAASTFVLLSFQGPGVGMPVSASFHAIEFFAHSWILKVLVSFYRAVGLVSAHLGI